MMKRRIALFGGSFDPIHRGHTDVARVASQHLQVETVIFIPAKCSPLKGAMPRVSDDHRLKMIELAIENDQEFAVSDCELHRPAPSFTLDTVKQFQSHYGPDVSIYWLLGADSVDDLVYWYKIEELIDTCHIAVMYRGGYEKPTFNNYLQLWGAERVAKLQNDITETPSIDISSTQIRRHLAEGKDVRHMLHANVADYIAQRDLYSCG